MEVRPVSIDELKPWDKNPRINDDAVDAVANSIKTFGFNVPILYDQHMMPATNVLYRMAPSVLRRVIVEG